MTIAAKIRRIQEADIPAFRETLKAVAEERKFLATVEAPSLDKTTRFVTNGISKGHPHYVAEIDGELVGWADIIPEDRETTRHSGHLGMGVLKEYRGKGLGTALLQTAMDECWQKGIKRIELEVFTDNQAAISLYRKLGFELEGTKRYARIIDGEFRDVHVMAQYRV